MGRGLMDPKALTSHRFTGFQPTFNPASFHNIRSKQGGLLRDHHHLFLKKKNYFKKLTAFSPQIIQFQFTIFAFFEILSFSFS